MSEALADGEELGCKLRHLLPPRALPSKKVSE